MKKFFTKIKEHLLKINWIVRLKNPVFIFQLVLAILTPVLAYMGITIQDLTSWGKLANVILSALSNPYVLGLIVINVFNATTDPTTKGICDSKKALTYKEPK